MADLNISKNSFNKLIGMKDIYVANVIQNDSTGYKTDTPIKFAPALGAKITAKVNTTELFGDDATQQVISALSEVDIELDVSCLNLEQIAMLYGQKVDKNGILVDNADDLGGQVAIGFRAKMSNNQYQFTWLYVCNFAGETNSYESIQGKIKGQDLTLKGTAIPRIKDRKWRARAQEGFLYSNGITTPQAMLDSWFTEVVEPDLSNLSTPTNTPVVNNTTTQS